MLEELGGEVFRLLVQNLPIREVFTNGTWKTPSNHRRLWINLAAAVVRTPYEVPGASFQRCGDLRGRPRLVGPSGASFAVLAC